MLKMFLSARKYISLQKVFIYSQKIKLNINLDNCKKVLYIRYNKKL